MQNILINHNKETHSSSDNMLKALKSLIATSYLQYQAPADFDISPKV